MKKNVFLMAIMTGLLMAGTALAQDLTTLQYRVPNMHCEHCMHRVRTAIGQNEGIDRVDIDLEKQVVSINYDAAKTTPDAITASLTEAKYPPTSYSPNDVISKAVTYWAEDMHCDNCAKKVTNNFAGIEGITGVETDVDTHTVKISYDANKISSETFKDSFRQIDYTVSEFYASELAQYARFKATSGALDEDAELDLYNEVEGIVDITLNEKTGVIAVTYDKRTLADTNAVKEAIEAQGYSLEVLN